MNILALDTSSPFMTVALVRDGVVFAEQGARYDRRKGESILDLVASCCAMAEVALADLDLLGVGLGPGGFTSVRIGVATAKGLALARELPLVGVPSLEVLARGFAATDALAVPVVDAYRGEVFTAVYRLRGDVAEALLAPMHAGPEEARRAIAQAVAGQSFVAGGDGLEKHGEGLIGDLPHTRAPRYADVPRAAALAHAAALRFEAEGASDLGTLEPLYVRPSDAQLPARPLRTT